MRLLFLVFLGGGLGSMARYILSKVIVQTYSTTFPVGTFLVNIIGCFIIGIVLTLPERFGNITVPWKLFLATGFCGGFTTFSAFAYENNNLIQNREILYFILYTTLSVLVGLLATFSGILLVKKFYNTSC
ncbi:MAG TPA: fluoride efflux transporter CrcB [Cytophagales bacterium]|nr:fluoride efflux transporter CrcB [Cytophagales bacterium]